MCKATHICYRTDTSANVSVIFSSLFEIIMFFSRKYTSYILISKIPLERGLQYMLWKNTQIQGLDIFIHYIFDMTDIGCNFPFLALHFTQFYMWYLCTGYDANGKEAT